jgi:hypothetical protein
MTSVHLANTWDFEQRLLRSAIAFSFERRGMAIPRDVPFALTEEFLSDPQKTKQWKAFLERLSSRKEAALSLVEVGEILRAFLVPCLLPATDSPLAHWTPNVGWRTMRRQNDSFCSRRFGYRFGYTHQFGLITRNSAKVRESRDLPLLKVTVRYAYLS